MSVESKKRPRLEQGVSQSGSEPSNSTVTLAFTSYKQELDDKHDRYERLVKLSRDVTIDSKRTIFLLHRALGDRLQTVCEDAAKTIEKIILGPLRKISLELQSQDRFKYRRAISPGLQEFVEAYTLLGYLRNSLIPPHGEICNHLVYSSTVQSKSDNDEPELRGSDDTTSVDLSPLDYMLGIADLTGELMRRAVGSVSRGDLDTPPALCSLLQTIEAHFRLACSELGRDAVNKMNVLGQSTIKVEKCCYTIKLRGSEVPQSLLASSLEERKPGSESCHNN